MRRLFRKIFSITAPLSLALVLSFVWLCYINQWDGLVVITLIPAWLWALAGMGVSFVFGAILKSRSCIVLFFFWLVFGVLLSDETRSLGREFRSAVFEDKIEAPEDARVYRVVSVNCYEKRLAAAEEIAALKPDIVFLQEAPGESELTDLIKKVFEGQGSHISHQNNAIIARGRFEEMLVVDPEKSTFRVRLFTPEGEIIDLANVHLRRSIPRFELWKRAVWNEFKEVRVDNRRVLRHLVRYRTVASNRGVSEKFVPLIVAGDFATPPGDDVFRMLGNAGLKDAAKSSRSGAVNTYPANFPLLRLNQIWHSDQVQPVKVETERSPHSDHKLIICELYLKKE